MNSRYYRLQVEQAISGAEGLANNLPLSSLRAFVFAIPPKDEATRISGFLQNELQRFNIISSRTEREIDLLHEYRTRLIADVVTGKLDVREAAARLQYEAELLDSDEVLDDSAEIDEMDDDAEGEA